MTGYIYIWSHDMRFPTMWYVRQAKPQISLHIHEVWSEPLLEYSMTVKLLTEQHLEFLCLKGGFTGSTESTLVKMPQCWKSHVAAHMFFIQWQYRSICFTGCICSVSILAVYVLLCFLKQSVPFAYAQMPIWNAHIDKLGVKRFVWAYIRLYHAYAIVSKSRALAL